MSSSSSDGQRWRMMRGDFANMPPGTPHAWTMKSDRAQLALFTMNDRVGAAFTAMGDALDGGTCRPRPGRDSAGRAGAMPRRPAISSWRRSRARRRRAGPGHQPAAARHAGPYVLPDGGGERFGGNTFLARTPIRPASSCSSSRRAAPGGGVGAHFHARHFENFFALDGETLGWAYGKAVPLKPATTSRRRRGTCTASAEPGLQPVRGVPHAGDLRELLHQGRRRRTGTRRWRRPRRRGTCRPGGGASGRGRGAVRGRRGRDVPDRCR